MLKIEIFTVSVAATQGPVPSGSFVVKINFALPAAISEELGVYVIVDDVLLGE